MELCFKGYLYKKNNLKTIIMKTKTSNLLVILYALGIVMFLSALS